MDTPNIHTLGRDDLGAQRKGMDGQLPLLAFLDSNADLFKERMMAWAKEAGAEACFSQLALCAETLLQSKALTGVMGEPQGPEDQSFDTRALLCVAGFDEEVQVTALLFLAEALREGQPGIALYLIRMALSDRFAPFFSGNLPGPASAMVRLFSLALEAGVGSDRVRELIRLHRLCPDAAGSLHWPWPVRIHTLGRFAVLCENAPLEFSGKSPRKALQLLQAVIANGGRDVPHELIIRNLWPDEAGGDTKNLFDNTLHRLRRLLGPVDVIMLRNGKLTLDPCACWVDAWTFQRLTRAVLTVGVPSDATQIVALQRDALAALRLYSGHFLQSEGDDPWMLAYRDRIKSRYLRLVRTLGTWLEQMGQWGLAIEIYERGLEVDNLTESLYRQLMLCHQQQGEHAEALRVYRRCRDLLSIVLGLAPSERTETVREASLRADRGRLTD